MMMPTPDPEAMDAMAEALLGQAVALAPEHGMDSLAMVMALSFAAMKGLYQIAEQLGMSERGLEFAETVNCANLAAMQEMVGQ